MVGVSGKRLLFAGWNTQFVWRPRFLFLGAYWYRVGNCWDLYLCLIPCVPFHVSWWYHDPEQ